MRLFPILFLLTFAAATARAQTSFRVGVLGPMPVFEQHFLPRHSIEVAFAPTHLFKQRYFSGEKHSALSTDFRIYTESKASTMWLAYRYFIDDYQDNEPWRDYIFLMVKQGKLSYRAEKDGGEGDEYIIRHSRENLAFLGGWGKRLASKEGITLDFATGLGFGSTYEKNYTIVYSELRGLTGQEGESYEAKTTALPFFHLALSLGYTIHTRKAKEAFAP